MYMPAKTYLCRLIKNKLISAFQQSIRSLQVTIFHDWNQKNACSSVFWGGTEHMSLLVGLNTALGEKNQPDESRWSHWTGNQDGRLLLLRNWSGSRLRKSDHVTPGAAVSQYQPPVIWFMRNTIESLLRSIVESCKMHWRYVQKVLFSVRFQSHSQAVEPHGMLVIPAALLFNSNIFLFPIGGINQCRQPSEGWNQALQFQYSHP